MKLTPEVIKQFVEKPFAFVEQTGIQAIELKDTDGTVVALGKGVYQLRPMAEIEAPLS